MLSWSSGGYWTIGFTGLESKKEVVETYFDASVGTDGSLDHRPRGMQQDRAVRRRRRHPIRPPPAPARAKCKVNEREDIDGRSAT